MHEVVNVTHRDGVAVLTVDNPPVNALSDSVAEALVTALAAADADPSIDAIVVAGAGRTFIAGADIQSLEQAAWGDETAAIDLHDILARIEDATKPVVMALHGTVLGGGLELAMAGHFRVALADTIVGQPEVNLGIIPGAEGTQRLPRLVGVQKAIAMCVTGSPIKAPDALASGLLDDIVTGDLVTTAVAFARDVSTRRIAGPKTRNRIDRLKTGTDQTAAFAAGHDLAAKRRRLETAPPRAIEAIRAAADGDWEAGCRRERALFLECIRSEQAKALIHVFFAERAAAKVTDVVGQAAPHPVSAVAIVGAGTMGRGIAMACANAGMAVILADRDDAALAAAIHAIRDTFASSVARGRITPDVAEQRLACIQSDPGRSRFASADVLIEAVFEDLSLKQEVLHDLDRAAKPGALLATNTSTIDIDRIAEATSRPDDVIGLHFFSPAQVMRLVEVVRGARTSPTAIATAMAMAKRLGKVGVLVGNGPGFVGNRMMFPYMYETQFMAEEGATPAEVDRALTDFGMAMGMFAVDDMAGIDVAWRVRQLGLFRDAGGRRPIVQDRLYELGRLGQKTGRGWYRYDEARKASADPEVIDLIREVAGGAGIPQRAPAPREIVERAIYALVNEGARALEAGVARRAADIDTIYVSGYGFPAWRGGPMFYADRVGLGVVLARIRGFHDTLGARWTPAPLLIRLAEEGRTFRDRDRAEQARSK